MKGIRSFTAGLLILCIATTVWAQNDTPQSTRYSFSSGPGVYSLFPHPYSPVAMPNPTAAMWTNPAGIGIDDGSGFMFTLPGTFGNADDGYNEDWGFGVNLGELAYGVQVARTDFEANWHTWGSSIEFAEGFNLGWAYHWSEGLDRENSWDLGLLIRPTRWISIGAQVTEVNEPRISYPDPVLGFRTNETLHPTYHLGLAVRPFETRMLTLTADATLWKRGESAYDEDIELLIGANFEPHPGIALRGGYAIESEYMYAGVSLYGGMAELGTWFGGKSVDSDQATNRADYSNLNWVRFQSQYRPSLHSLLRKKKFVTMELSGMIVEQPEPFSFFRPQNRTIYEVLNQVERLTEDDEVGGLILELDDLRMGFSDRTELRDALEAFKDAGKVLVVYANSLGMGNYYLATVADHVVLNPNGEVWIPGFYVNQFYLRGLLDKLGIEAQFLTVGQYKSAAEILTREDASDPAKEALDLVVEALWQEWLNEIADGRDVNSADVADWVDDGTIFVAEDALEDDLIDHIAYRDELQEYIQDQVGYSPRMASASMYFRIEDEPMVWEDMTSPKIAVIYGVGAIEDGESGRGGLTGEIMGGETVARAIRNARNNPRVKAIVFRVDSPGGSALGSDLVRREIDRTVGDAGDDNRRIPFIVSMSDVAGSGGYWISAKADTIVAPETCITGSIGVLGGKFILSEMYDSLGISFDGVQRGENANLWSTDHRWNETQERMLQRSMEVVYEDFLELVAEGRGMDTSRVNELGQGRIWSGRDAVENGLVDLNGGFATAIAIAREAAGIDADTYVDIEFYSGCCGFDPMHDVRTAIISTLPENVRTALRAEAVRSAINEGEPLLLMPVNTEALEE